MPGLVAKSPLGLNRKARSGISAHRFGKMENLPAGQPLYSGNTPLEKLIARHFRHCLSTSWAENSSRVICLAVHRLEWRLEA